MNIQEKSKIEYRSRINRVMDYIDTYINEPLEIKDIAEISKFSPYHFHRIFTFLIGETPIDYIQRLRVEKTSISKATNTPANYTTTNIGYIPKTNTLSIFTFL